MASTDQIIAFLEDETYSYAIVESTDPLGTERFFVYSAVRGMIDDYSRAFVIVGKPIATSSRRLYIDAYRTLGHIDKYISPFTLALIKAKSKNLGFNFSPKSEKEQTGSGTVSYTNKAIEYGKKIVEEGSKIPESFLSIPESFLSMYQLVPVIGVAVLAVVAYGYLPKKK